MKFVCKAPESASLFLDRFNDALRLLCGKEPPKDRVLAWFHEEDNSLQDWAASNALLKWSQGIEVIDAALGLANSPEEGRQHKMLGEE